MSNGSPLLVVTVLLDSSARSAAITRSHGDAMERALNASVGHETAGMDLAELPIAKNAFANLRRSLTMPPDTVALYDIFPLNAALPAEVQKLAGQFLAAEALWALEEQGLLGGVPPNERFDLPKGWSKDPKDIRAKLVEAGANQLSEEAIRTFQAIKQKWDGAQPAPAGPTAGDDSSASA
ncbi:MAG: hypothetical protein AAGF12_37475 [Myxococcota bacterium]